MSWSTVHPRASALAVTGSCLVAVGLPLAHAGPAHATVPGGNRKIAFTSERTGSDQVFVMSADGSGQTQLTTDTNGSSAPAWSPDGTRIAFDRVQTGGDQIWAMRADGSNQAPLTADAPAAADVNPA